METLTFILAPSGWLVAAGTAAYFNWKGRKLRARLDRIFADHREVMERQREIRAEGKRAISENQRFLAEIDILKIKVENELTVLKGGKPKEYIQ